MTAVTQTLSNHTILQGEGGEQGDALMLGEAQARHKEGGSEQQLKGGPSTRRGSARGRGGPSSS